MRVLHTSDWHLGRNFGTVSLLDDQYAFIDWFVSTARDQRVDLVVVAGDVFDRAIAANEAVVLFREALRRLVEFTKVAVITGNHDGADRVNTYGDLLDLSGVLLRGGYDTVGEVLTVQAPDGPLDLVLLPFLDPQAAPDDYPVDGSADPVADAFERRVRRTHQEVLATAAARAAAALRSPRSLAVAHAFVTGGEETESERRLTVGGTGQVEAAMFQPFSYTALGHLHKPQVVTGGVRYSGTPLAYSFSEAHAKSVTLVDMAPDGSFTVDELPVPVGRPVLTVRGTIDQLLSTAPSDAARGSFVRAILTDVGVVLDAKSRLAAVYPHVVEIVPEPEGAPTAPVGGLSAGQRRAMAPTDVADAFWQAATHAAPSADEQTLLHHALVQAEHEQVG